MYEMKMKSIFDSHEYDQHLLKRFIENCLKRKELLAHQFTRDQLEMVRRTVDWIEEPYIADLFEQAEGTMKISENIELGTLTNKELEKKAADLKISLITVEDIWQVAVDALKEVGPSVSLSKPGHSR
jgi:hypothetical protein